MSRDLEDALGRLRRHALNATLEGLEALRALAEATQIAGERGGRGSDSGASPLLGPLDELMTALRSGRLLTPPPALARALTEALDAEIERWERRSRTDSDARLVLRAFLGLRELTWEIGWTARESGPASPDAPPPARREGSRDRRGKPEGRRSRPDRGPPPGTRRVQRFEIES